MNTWQNIEVAMEILSKELEWEYFNDRLKKWIKPGPLNCPMFFAKIGFQIRVKPKEELTFWKKVKIFFDI